MKFPFFQVDAFVEGPFSGNPAAVCVPAEDLDDDCMLAIARENNLSETAFLRRLGSGWGIRWFTPGAEVDLCGHATLAAGAVLLDRLEPGLEEVAFDSRSGTLGVRRTQDGFELDFPAWPAAPADPDTADAVATALGCSPREVFAGHYLMAVFGREADVRRLAPDLAAVAALPAPGLIATAPGEDVAFVSRFFAPALAVPEDPATGSAHAMLAPWWARRRGAGRMVARQVSPRGGLLECESRGDRVRIAGRVRFVIEGRFSLQG